MGNGQTYKPATGTDIDILARTVYGEARGEYLAGQIQVAFTILRRATLAAQYVTEHGKPHPHYGDGSILSACKADRQYSCWNVSDPNYSIINQVTLNDAKFQTALYVAVGAVQRMLTNAMPTATHYLNPQAVNQMPAWVTGVPAHGGKPAIPPARKLGSVGRHEFFDQVAA